MISKADRTGLRHPPVAFTEQGVAMLSSVLRGKRAVSVNIEIMRAFVKLRQMLASNTELARRLDELEGKYDKQFRTVFDAIRQLMAAPVLDRKEINFGKEYLGVDYIFWCTEEPYYSEHLVPFMKR